MQAPSNVNGSSNSRSCLTSNQHRLFFTFSNSDLVQVLLRVDEESCEKRAKNLGYFYYFFHVSGNRYSYTSNTD